jgi:predicted transcriptional regulator
MMTTIQVPDDLKMRLSKLKKHPRQPYSEVIAEALDYIEEDERELTQSAKIALTEARKEFKAGQTRSMADVRRELGL